MLINILGNIDNLHRLFILVFRRFVDIERTFHYVLKVSYDNRERETFSISVGRFQGM